MQVKPQWKEITEFSTICEKLIEKFPDRFQHIDPDWIVAYGCVNKEKKDNKVKPYEMTGQAEPESFTNSKKYFVKFFQSDWDSKSEEAKLILAFSALSRIDSENPASGKVGPLDYRDQAIMVNTFGPNWLMKNKFPNILKDNVRFKDEVFSLED